MDIQNLARRLQKIEHFNKIPLDEVERVGPVR
jgi:hypothetical protein